MSKILVTGAAGFIGSHLVDNLLLEGHEVVGIDNLRNGKLRNLKLAQENRNFQFIKGDILDRSIVQEALENIEVIYHLACLGVRHSLHSPFENHKVNAEGTLILLEEAKNKKIEKFFYISTSEIYGKTTSFPIDELAPTNPLTVYGASKLAGEHYTNSFFECFGMDTTVLRIFNNYGPRSHHEGDCGEVIPRSIVKILNGENPVIFGDGKVTRDFFYVKDTANLLTSLLNKQGISGKTFNVGTGEEITIKELLELVVSLMPEFLPQIEFLEERPADVPRLWVNNAKLKSIIDLKQGLDFKEGLKETIEFFKELNAEGDLISEMNLLNWQK